jgi:hypothetical protein
LNTRKKTAKKPSLSLRPFTTSYALWSGHCKTREGAIQAATKHVLKDGYTTCSIDNRDTGAHVASVRVDNNRLGYSVKFAKPLLPGILRRVK